MLKLIKVCGLIIMLLFYSELGKVALAKPIDSNAAKESAMLAQLVNQPRGRRIISEAKTQKYIMMTKADNIDRQLCAVLILAFAKDNISLNVLKKLSKNTNILLSGAAYYAIRVRSTSNMNADEALNSLSFWLSRSENAFERMFLANRIAVDFPEKGMHIIMIAARDESNQIVRCDMLYYLAQTDDTDIINEILGWEWNEKGIFPENLAFIMGAITPGRPKDSISNSCGVLLQKIRKKRDSHIEPYKGTEKKTAR